MDSAATTAMTPAFFRESVFFIHFTPETEAGRALFREWAERSSVAV
jgi:hypothetical protein